jgi:ribonuclease-3
VRAELERLGDGEDHSARDLHDVRECREVGVEKREIDAAVPGERDPKTSLQERAARHRLTVVYELVGTAGPPQQRVFTTRVRVGDEVLGTGSGSSKQASERAAAVEALSRLSEGAAAC